jgi:formylglycine-generating enzyme required for sulfatase activity
MHVMSKIKIFSVVMVVLFLSLSVSGISTAFASNRTALVIGNGKYQSSPLKNPVNDAIDIAKALKHLGFDVILKKNVDKQGMEDAMRIFGRKLANSKIGLFYYAGHGMQVKGINYLIPVKNNIKEESEVSYFAVNAGFVLAKMEAAGNPLNIVILDACRDNPFKRSFSRSSAVKGLASMDAPEGTIIAYATKAGDVAEDGQGRNGTYTSALLNNIANPALDVRDMFNKVGLEVKGKTSGSQIPWTSNDPFPDYYLAGGTETEDSSSGSSNAGMLKINSNPPGADIFIHGKFRGTAPLEIKNIDPGSYTIKAVLSDYNAEVKKVKVNRGRKAVVDFYLDPAVSKARLYVTSKPSDCKIRILNIQPAFYNGIELDSGRIYRVEVSKKHYKTKVQNVEINSSQGIDLYVELEKLPDISGGAGTPGQGQTWREPVTGMEFVWVPQGCYQMGSNSGDSDEKPVHKVCLDGFWMAKHEVTNRQYRKYKSSHDSKDYKGVNLNRDDQPAVYVSWDDAKAFAKWLSSKSGKQIALPTEAQWEYAARAGTGTVRYWGDDADDACRYANVHDRTSKNKFSNFTWQNHNCNDGYAGTSPVGSFRSNNFGLYDMLGNVWEWCEDVYDKEAYSKHSRNNPLVLSGGSDRVLRGGSWSSKPWNVRSAYRYRYSASFTLDYLGFRLIRKN